MRLVLKMMRKYWYFAIFAAVFMVAEVYVDLYQPKMMAVIVDEGILGVHNGGVSNLQLIISVGIRMVLVVALGGMTGILSAVATNMMGQSSGNDMRKACFEKAMHLSFQQTDAFSSASLITRITNDVGQVQRLEMQLVRGLIRCLMFFAGGTTALLSLDLSFGVIVACAFPLILIDVIFVIWRTNPLFLMLQKALDKVNAIMEENVNGIRVVKAFVQEDREETRFEAANKELVDTQFTVQMLLSFLRPVMNIVLNLAVVGIIYVGSVRVQEGAIAPGSVMAAITYISQILNGMMMVVMIFQTLSRGLVSAGRIQEVLDTKPAITRRKSAAQAGTEQLSSSPTQACTSQLVSVSDTGTCQGTVRFRRVSFSYPDNPRHIRVLRNIDLEIRAGETFAIIGSTASGKSTLVNLIPRFYDVRSGAVEVDGIDVRDYDLTVLRDKVTVCLQKSELFSTTIRDNIALGIPDASEEAIIRAAKAAQAHDFIMQQPQGYDTPVAEGGMSLSGGQRQRIAIARALLKKGEILIFDDSTSALDLRTEAKLFQALDREYGHLTRIIIAQRVASVKNADRILVLDHGRISACGNHEQLMTSSPVYRAIYESQINEGTRTNGVHPGRDQAGKEKGGVL